jgi:transposase-like protein
MDEAQAPETRRQRNPVEAKQLVAEYSASGMGRQEFCRQHGMALVTLDRYRRRFQKASSGASGEGRWLTVELKGDGKAAPQGGGSGLAVVLPGDKRIEVAAGFDARTLHELVRALESL